MTVKLTDFCMKHFERKNKGTKVLDHTPAEFEAKVKEALECTGALNPDGYESSLGKIYVREGYAPFCKLVAIPNFTDARVGSVPITESNYQYLRSGYSSRRDNELPVLSRWLELPLGKPKADWLILVLYSKEQIDKEAKCELPTEVQYNGHDEPDFDADWGIITILGQSHPNEEPMAPITMIRNAYMAGGSGAPIDEAYYKRAAEFWHNNAVVR